MKVITTGWVLVSEVRGSSRGYGEKTHEEWAEEYGVELAYDWKGRPVIAAKDAARIVAESTQKGADSAEMLQGFESYLQDYEWSRHYAAALADEIAVEMRRRESMSVIRGKTRRMTVMTLSRAGGRIGGVEILPPGPAARTAGRHAYSAAYDTFDRIAPKPLQRDEWDRKGRPQSVFGGKRRGVIVRAAAEGAGLAASEVEKWMVEKGYEVNR